MSSAKSGKRAQDNRITVRLTPFEREAIELLVKQGSYVDMTDFTRKAIQNQLKAEGMDPAKVSTGNEGSEAQ